MVSFDIPEDRFHIPASFLSPLDTFLAINGLIKSCFLHKPCCRLAFAGIDVVHGLAHRADVTVFRGVVEELIGVKRTLGVVTATLTCRTDHTSRRLSLPFLPVAYNFPVIRSQRRRSARWGLSHAALRGGPRGRVRSWCRSDWGVIL